MASYAEFAVAALATTEELCGSGLVIKNGASTDWGLRMAKAFGQDESVGMTRPLSPHLQVYRPMLTMMMSIAHRITGVALYAGTILLGWYLIALASGPDAFATVAWFLDSLVGRIVLFGFTWALFHHLLGGIRHFLWDQGLGMDDPEREWLAQGTLIGGIALTILVWIAALVLQ